MERVQIAPTRMLSSLGEPRHISALDGLRAIALMLVMFHHWSQLYSPANWSDHNALGKVVFFIGEGCWCGVDLFFVLSGFLITGILLDTRAQPRFFSNFYLRRTLRIFPPYYLFLFATFVLARPFLSGNSTWQTLNHQQLWYWLYLENWHTAFFGWAPYSVLHFWSLAVEEQFYLFWPLLVFMCGPRRIIAISLAIIALSPVLRFLIADHSSLPYRDAFVYVATITRMGPLAWGAILAAMMRLPGGAQRLKRFAPVLAIAGWTALIALMAVDHNIDKVDPIMRVYGYAAFALFFAGLVGWLLTHNEKHVVVRVSSSALLRQIGKVSYVAYIVHLPLFVFAASRFPTHRIAALIVCTATTFAIAFASWRFFERPLLKLKNRIAPSLTLQARPPQSEPIAGSSGLHGVA